VKAHYRTKNGQITFEVQGEQVKDLFEQIAGVQEVFEAECECGLCKSKNVNFRVRTVDDNKYYELACECGARFQFGQNKKGGGLFPKRKDKESMLLPNGGWAKWNGKNGD